MFEWIDRAVEHLVNLPTWLALGLIFLLPALESSIMLGFVVPGEIAVVVGGIIAAHPDGPPVAAVIIVAVIGAVVGDQIGYYVGHRWGETLLLKVPDRLLGPRRIAAGQQYIRELGAKAVILGRWTAALRALVPGIAGMSHMDYRRFTIANIVGGAGWAIACALVGYGAGNVQAARKSLGKVPFIVGTVLALLVLFVVARSRRRKEHRMMEELADEGLAAAGTPVVTGDDTSVKADEGADEPDH